MSLRTRLILAFFTLSVVPMAAVTLYSYATNVEALREAAEREADLLAGELGQRMQLVTAQLSDRSGPIASRRRWPPPAARRCLSGAHRIEQAVAAFRGKSEPLDDATLMTVKVG